MRIKTWVKITDLLCKYDTVSPDEFNRLIDIMKISDCT